MKSLPMLAAALLLAVGATGCKTTDPVTGDPIYDPQSTLAITESFRGATAAAVHEVVTKNPDLREYFHEASIVICRMAETGQVNPDAVLMRLNEIAKEKGLLDEPLVFHGTNVLVTLLRVNVTLKYRVAMDPEEWPQHLMNVLCNGIKDGLQTT